MKKLMLILMLVVCMFAAGCEKEKDGVTCIRYGTGWTAVADICVNCKTYQLSNFCTDCGSKMASMTGRGKCVKCDGIGFFTNYCGHCGGKVKHVLIER